MVNPTGIVLLVLSFVCIAVFIKERNVSNQLVVEKSLSESLSKRMRISVSDLETSKDNLKLEVKNLYKKLDEKSTNEKELTAAQATLLQQLERKEAESLQLKELKDKDAEKYHFQQVKAEDEIQTLKKEVEFIKKALKKSQETSDKLSNDILNLENHNNKLESARNDVDIQYGSYKKKAEGIITNLRNTIRNFEDKSNTPQRGNLKNKDTVGETTSIKEPESQAHGSSRRGDGTSPETLPVSKPEEVVVLPQNSSAVQDPDVVKDLNAVVNNHQNSIVSDEENNTEIDNANDKKIESNPAEIDNSFQDDNIKTKEESVQSSHSENLIDTTSSDNFA